MWGRGVNQLTRTEPTSTNCYLGLVAPGESAGYSHSTPGSTFEPEAAPQASDVASTRLLRLLFTGLLLNDFSTFAMARWTVLDPGRDMTRRADWDKR